MFAKEWIICPTLGQVYSMPLPLSRIACHVCLEIWTARWYLLAFMLSPLFKSHNYRYWATPEHESCTYISKSIYQNIAWNREGVASRGWSDHVRMPSRTYLSTGKSRGQTCSSAAWTAKNHKLWSLITQFAEPFVRVPKAAPWVRDLAADGCHRAQEGVVGWCKNIREVKEH